MKAAYLCERPGTGAQPVPLLWRHRTGAAATHTHLRRLSLPGSASSSAVTVRPATFSACVQSAVISRWSGMVPS